MRKALSRTGRHSGSTSAIPFRSSSLSTIGPRVGSRSSSRSPASVSFRAADAKARRSSSGVYWFGPCSYVHSLVTGSWTIAKSGDARLPSAQARYNSPAKAWAWRLDSIRGLSCRNACHTFSTYAAAAACLSFTSEGSRVRREQRIASIRSVTRTRWYHHHQVECRVFGLSRGAARQRECVGQTVESRAERFIGRTSLNSIGRTLVAQGGKPQHAGKAHLLEIIERSTKGGARAALQKCCAAESHAC